ncbi:MAG: dihydropteroate synthase [Bacteroidaceae bacterium]|nr:dihydropteroate synthase [Bacteroidaceae bacterium]
MKMSYTINVRGRLLQLDKPVVMGILNITDDSFFDGSRVASPVELVDRAKSMLDAGAAILDVGACSTRPGATPVGQDVELARLHSALELLDKELSTAVVSVDTFRAAVVRECAAVHNVSIINDVSCLEWDDDMFSAVVDSKLPYILTHSLGLAGNEVEYSDFLPQVLQRLAAKMWQLRQAGVADVIVDPGFGFGKNVEQNYRMLASLRDFEMLDAPLLVGLSRKSMITRLLDIEPGEALAATTALNLVAVRNGANILRVHDVEEAVQAIKLAQAMDFDK